MSLSVLAGKPFAMEAARHPGSIPAGREVPLPQRPVLIFWFVAVALEVAFGVAFVLTGADSAIDEGLSRAGVDFSSDLLTAIRVVAAYPAAALGVLLAVGQVAAPDLAVWVVSRLRGGRALLQEVRRRFGPGRPR